MFSKIIELREWSDEDQLVDIKLANKLNELGVCTVLLAANGNAKLSSFRKVGVVSDGDVIIRIEPKVSIRNILFMLDENINSLRMLDNDVHLVEDKDWTHFLLHYFLKQLQHSLSRGPLEGYEEISEFAQTIRGRIEFSKLAHHWYSGNIEIPVRYDELNINIIENQILRTAIEVALTTIPMPDVLRLQLENYNRLLASCSLLNVGATIPEVSITPRNHHYKSVLTTAQLIISGTSVSNNSGSNVAKSFLIDMPLLFEKYIERKFKILSKKNDIIFAPQKPDQFLDSKNLIGIRPDYLWFRNGVAIGLADAKYKIVKNQEIPTSDVYQCLAYATRYQLSDVHLIYAEASSFETQTIGSRVNIRVHGVNLSASREDLDTSIENIFNSLLGSSAGMRSVS